MGVRESAECLQAVPVLSIAAHGYEHCHGAVSDSNIQVKTSSRCGLTTPINAKERHSVARKLQLKLLIVYSLCRRP